MANLLGLLGTSLIVTLGTFWAFERGAPDFSVFYSAWKLVLAGRGAEIYQTTVTPDRFLYAPGFAWLLSPLGLLPRSMALALWCFFKAGIVGYLVREFRARQESIGVAALGVLILARPLLIDFQYGQVNVLILGACAWALLGHFRSDEPGALDFVRWMLLAIAALAKLFPLPLLVVPWLVREGIAPRRLWLERAGLVTGLLVTLASPVLTQGMQGMLALMHGWHLALIARGLPLESHNQSFAAFLHHYFTGEPTHVVAQGVVPVMLGVPWLSGGSIGLLSRAWMLLSGAFVLGWLLVGSLRPPKLWIAVLVSLLILPSHLVWKPYFVMALPLAILAATQSRDLSQRVGLFVVFALANLTGFDFVGHAWGARFEAASTLLWAELLLLMLALRASRVERRA